MIRVSHFDSTISENHLKIKHGLEFVGDSKILSNKVTIFVSNLMGDAKFGHRFTRWILQIITKWENYSIVIG